MKTIPLSQGKCAIVDDNKYDSLSKYKWCAVKSRNTFYAARTENGKRIYMHREVMGLSFNNSEQVDHINHDGLDNKLLNLRSCMPKQNQYNLKSIKGSSKYKGVCWHKGAKKWRASIFFNYHNYYLGVFVSEVEAAKAYNIAADYYYGKFAYLNVLMDV